MLFLYPPSSNSFSLHLELVEPKLPPRQIIVKSESMADSRAMTMSTGEIGLNATPEIGAKVTETFRSIIFSS